MDSKAFLFISVDDASARWERDHRAMNLALVQMDRLLQEAVRARRGRVVERRGDGALAMLPAAQGVRCALALQQSVQAADWRPFSGLPLRMGLQRCTGPNDHAAAAEAEALARLLRGGGILLCESLLTETDLPTGVHSAAAGHLALLPATPAVGGVQVFAEGRPRPILQASVLPPLAPPPRDPLLPEQMPQVAEAASLCRLAERQIAQGESEAAVATARRAQALWLPLQDRAGESWSLALEAQARLRQGRPEPGLGLARQALEAAEAAADPDRILGALAVLTDACFSTGDGDAARAHCGRALALARPRQATWALAVGCLQMAILAELQSSYREASYYLDLADRESRRLAPGGSLGFNVLALRIQVALQLGHYDLCEGLIRRAMDPREWPATPGDLAWPRNLLAQLQHLRGDYAAAQALCERGLEDLGPSQDGGSWYKENLSAALFAQGQTARALDLALQSLHAAEQSGRLRGVAWCQNRLGLMELAAGRYPQARERLESARQLHARLGEPLGLASDELAIARLERLEGDPAKAAGLAESVIAAFQSFSMPQGAARAQIELGACFLAQGETSLALEPVELGLRQAATIGAWPVFCRGLRRLAEIRLKEGKLKEGMQGLAACQAHGAADAELKEICRGLLATLGQGAGPEALAEAEAAGKAMSLLQAAALLGVEIVV